MDCNIERTLRLKIVGFDFNRDLVDTGLIRVVYGSAR